MKRKRELERYILLLNLDSLWWTFHSCITSLEFRRLISWDTELVRYRGVGCQTLRTEHNSSLDSCTTRDRALPS